MPSILLLLHTAPTLLKVCSTGCPWSLDWPGIVSRPPCLAVVVASCTRPASGLYTSPAPPSSAVPVSSTGSHRASRSAVNSLCTTLLASDHVGRVAGYVKKTNKHTKVGIYEFEFSGIDFILIISCKDGDMGFRHLGAITALLLTRKRLQ